MGRLWVPEDALNANKTVILRDEDAVVHLDGGPQERLRGLRATVHEDGGAASFATHFSGHRPFWCHVGIEEIAAIEQEIRNARESMIDIQLMGMDRGDRVIQSLPAHALVPSETVATVDPMTRDRFFTFHFADRSPFAVRMTTTATILCRHQISQAEACYSH